MSRTRPPLAGGKVRYDATFRKVADGKSHFVKIGVGFPGDGGRINVVLDALPINDWDGRITLFPHPAEEEVIG